MAQIPTTPSSGSLLMYENDGAPILAAALALKKQRWAVLNERGRELELEANRMHLLPGTLPSDKETTDAKTKYLSGLSTAAQSEKVPLEEVWSILTADGQPSSDLSTADICEMYFGDISLSHYLATRYALLSDKLYFKRNRDLFAPRTAEIVEELRKAEEARLQRQRLYDETVEFVKKRAQNRSLPIPPAVLPTIELFKEIVVAEAVEDAHKHREALDLLAKATTAAGIELSGRPEQAAFKLLEKIGIFQENTNLSLLRHKPRLEFSPEALAHAAELKVDEVVKNGFRQDLTHLDTFTIDDQSTKDMDDALSIEEIAGGYRIGVHITDVASVIEPGTPLDREAAARATSIYIPEGVINMLPRELSEAKLSLIAGTVRPCTSCIFELGRDLVLRSSTVVASLVKVARRFSYDEVDRALEDGSSTKFDRNFEALYNFAVDHETERLAGGGMRINKHEVSVVLKQDGTFHLVQIDEASPGRSLVAEMAVLANATFAQFAIGKGFPLVYRSQDAPDESDTEKLKGIPEGAAYDYAMRTRLKRSTTSVTPASHATLGLPAYAQVTSPIRRYLDLVNQRQVSYLETGKARYNEAELSKYILESETPLNIAGAVSKETKKYWLLKHLQKVWSERRTIAGIVTRVDGKNPLVELDEVFLTLPVRMEKRPELGSRINVRVGGVDPRWDYIKLEAVS